MKNKILILPLILLMPVFCPLGFAQIKSDALLVSISPAETVSTLEKHRKFRIRIENETAGTIRLWSRNVTLGISPVALEDCNPPIKIEPDKKTVFGNNRKLRRTENSDEK